MRREGGRLVKYFWLPAAILAFLLGVSLWNAHAVDAEIAAWCEIVESARTAARDGDLDGAKARMAELGRSWRTRRAYYHSVLEHDELDDAEEFYARAASALETGDTDDFFMETAALAAQLQVIAEMQALTLENVL